jgi:hypothetical protein
MVPVLVALTETAMRTDIVRENIETAVKDGKEWLKEVREECKRENERWDAERKALGGDEKTNESDQKVLSFAFFSF